jgi:glycine cleavage system aminomethyltransferase T
MSVYAPSEGASSPLGAVLRQAGAVFSTRSGQTVPTDFGSAAGELSVCIRAVGLVDRSELTKLVIEARTAQLEHLIDRIAGAVLGPGGALHAAGAWWCAAAADVVTIVSDPQVGERLRAQLRTEAVHHALTIIDHTADWAAIEVLGPAAGKVLRGVGVYGEAGDPRQVAPFTSRPLAGIPAQWLLKSDHRALALVTRERAGDAWLEIERAGRPFGISCVGFDAASRYELLERAARPAPLAC